MIQSGWKLGADSEIYKGSGLMQKIVIGGPGTPQILHEINKTFPTNGKCLRSDGPTVAWQLR